MVAKNHLMRRRGPNVLDPRRAVPMVMKTTDNGPIVMVHILNAGVPRCGFSRSVPAKWPAGHRWVSDREAMDATCPECVGALLKTITP